MSNITVPCPRCGVLLPVSNFNLHYCGDNYRESDMLHAQTSNFQATDPNTDASEPLVNTILAERGKRYGSFAANSQYAQQLIAVIEDAQIERTKQDTYDLLQPHHVNALHMIAQKISRILSGDANYADNWDDIAGFAQLGKNPR